MLKTWNPLTKTLFMWVHTLLGQNTKEYISVFILYLNMQDKITGKYPNQPLQFPVTDEGVQYLHLSKWGGEGGTIHCRILTVETGLSPSDSRAPLVLSLVNQGIEPVSFATTIFWGASQISSYPKYVREGTHLEYLSRRCWLVFVTNNLRFEEIKNCNVLFGQSVVVF